MRKPGRKFIGITMLILASLLTALFFTGCGDEQNPVEEAFLAQAPSVQPGEASFSPDTILVKFKEDANIAAINAQFRLAVRDIIPAIDVHVLRVPAGRAVEIVNALSRNPNVEYAELDYKAFAVENPNDPHFGLQWGLPKIKAPEAWDVNHGDPSHVIAILDTGIDQDNEDLATKIVDNKNYTTSPTVDDLYGHGTHCAGIAAAITNNLKGVAGLGWECGLMNVKVLDDSGSGSYSWVSKGIIYATFKGARVISMSLSGSSSSNTLKRAVNYAWRKGVVIAAAAGNDGWKYPVYPAFYYRCIAVAATDTNDLLAYFSNYGGWVDVAAPGVNIYSTLPNHGSLMGKDYGYANGTSMATPYVAGLACLLWSTSHGTDNATVRARIESTCDPATLSLPIAYGRIDAYEAVKP